MSVTINGTTGVSLVQNGVLTDANMPSGSVLQVVQGTYSSLVTTTAGNATYVDTNLSASITPSSASNKVLAIVTHSRARKAGDNVCEIRLLRDSTVIFGNLGNFDTSSTAQITDTITFSYLDSPNTTSQVTYKTQFASANGYIYGPSTLILMEIAA